MERAEDKAWQNLPKAVGVIGLGDIGAKICRRLVQEEKAAGITKIAAFDVDSSILEGVGKTGVTPAKSVAHLVDMVDLLLLCLPKAGDVGKIARAHDGLLDSVRQGQIIVDHSWSSVDLTSQLATAFSSRGAAFIDAPIGRSGDLDRDIETGGLAFAISGDKAAIEAASPLLRCLAKEITNVGPAGGAQVVRQLGDLVTLQTFTALAEALVTAGAFNIEGSRLVDALSKGRGGLSGFGRDGLTEFVGDGYELDDQRPSITDAGRRLRDAVELAERKKVNLAGAGSTLALLDEAVEKGIGEEELSGLLSLIEPAPLRGRRP